MADLSVYIYKRGHIEVISSDNRLNCPIMLHTLISVACLCLNQKV